MATNNTTRQAYRESSPDSSDSDSIPFESSNKHSRTGTVSTINRESLAKTSCRYRMNCFNRRCGFNHPTGWNPCEDGENCEEYNCEAKHPPARKRPCRNGFRCRRGDCHFLHPVFRTNACPAKAQCEQWDCNKWHPKNRPDVCDFGTTCFNLKCLRLHPPERNMCEFGFECGKYDCPLDHPPTRTKRCEHGNTCSNYFCGSLHPNDSDPCKEGSQCKNIDCPHAVHPADRVIIGNTKQETSTRIVLKTLQQRQVERECSPLPILSVKEEFCRRLGNERILVITAETGSGKSTQLPQYIAEHFGGLVVCTQPRVLAAVGLARRVAEEYDGTSVGYSVGYRVGHSSMGKDKNRVPGREIVFMTDGMFIQESQLNSGMKDMKVLMIDEAHERTLNTDIVLGIAKQMLDERPEDFYVVISSATIVAEDFLRFFGRETDRVLNVLGRPYEVTEEYIGQSSRKNEPVEAYAVSTLLQSFDQHEGNVLVFLPGVTQIDNAIDNFKRKLPKNCIALPLYSALSPEEQELILQFDGGPDKKHRMVVFCTNIAETSLTINNVRLVIDSGLANEARYDYESRLTIIESLRISRASAEQRKGRAGRMAKGHCIRLYDEADLVERDTKPQILCSSLDIVVLQLLNLGLDPFKFPFMDPPETDSIQASFDLLKQLDCVNETGRLTAKGELFGKLGIEPRYSAVLFDAYLEHKPILDLVSMIVAVCIAPSTVFAIDGDTKEEKVSARERIQRNGHQYDSDLLYMAEEYKKWREIAVLDPNTRTCRICLKTYARGYFCGPCRAAYSRTHLLSHKVLNYIESMSEELATKMIAAEKCFHSNTLTDANESVIIGNILGKHFPERCGCLITPPSKKIDAHMDRNGLPVGLSGTSTFIQRKPDNKRFIATLMLKTTYGAYKIDRLHPLPEPNSVES